LGTHHARSFTRVDLAHHALRHLPGLERIVETEAADVAVRADAFDAREILDLRHLHALSSLGHLLSLPVQIASGDLTTIASSFLVFSKAFGNSWTFLSCSRYGKYL